MEQQIRVWLRYCIPLGVYLRENNENTAKIITIRNNKHDRDHKQEAWSQTRQQATVNARLQQLHVSFLLCTICVLYTHGLYWRGYIPGLMLTWITSTVIFTSQICTNLLIIMETIWKRSQHETFLTLLDEIEVSLKLRLRQDVQRLALCRNMRAHLVHLLVISLAAMTLFIITSLWLNYIGYFWHGLWSIVTMRLRLIQIIMYVRILRHYLRCLCAKLCQIEAYRRAPDQQMLDINYEKLASLEYLLAIKEIYSLLHRCFRLLNNFAGWSLFSIITCYMFDFSCNVYWTLLSFDGFARRRYYYIAGPAAMFPLIALICHLCYLCDNCMKLVSIEGR